MRNRYYAEQLESIRALARQTFATTGYRSLLYLVAEYWGDSAADTLHTQVIASYREQPQWPHRCANDFGDDEWEWKIDAPMHVVDIEPQPLPDSDRCQLCESTLEAPDPSAAAMPYMFEGAYEETLCGMYAPFALARRVGDSVEVEIVGEVQRPYDRESHGLVPRGRDPLARWIDEPDARALYDLACASGRDDSPRRVLADYLLERGHPHGELIALSLVSSLDAEARARHDELLDLVGKAWLSLLEPVVRPDQVTFERGFVAHVELHHEAPLEAVVGSAAWASVESVRTPMPGPVIDQAMDALREVATLDGSGIGRLAARERPWAIEKLAVCTDRLEPLLEIETLPRLVSLRIAGATRAVLDRIDRARWWTNLAHLSLCDLPIGEARDRSKQWGRSLAVVHDGWELWLDGMAPAIEVTKIGWTTTAFLGRLCALLREALPGGGSVVLKRSRYFAADPIDARLLREELGDTFSIAT